MPIPASAQVSVRGKMAQSFANAVAEALHLVNCVSLYKCARTRLLRRRCRVRAVVAC